MISFEQIKQLFMFDTSDGICTEILFHLKNDPDYYECWIGKTPDQSNNYSTYWIGLPEKVRVVRSENYYSFDAMAIDPIFKGKSLEDIWDEVIIDEIDGMDPNGRVDHYLYDFERSAKVYSLFFNYTEDDEDGFHIGIFLSRERAEEVKSLYLKHIPGFNEYELSPKITEVIVEGGRNLKAGDSLICFQGWNENDNLDSYDVFNSVFYSKSLEAQMMSDYNIIKNALHRQEWAVEEHLIDDCNWKDGFIRTHN